MKSPSDYDANFWLGKAYFHTQHYDKALRSFSKAKEKKDKSEVDTWIFYTIRDSSQNMTDYIAVKEMFSEYGHIADECSFLTDGEKQYTANMVFIY